MRVRYKMYNTESYSAECDLTSTQASKLFDELKCNPLCIWGQLIGEDEGNYMEVLDYFDNSYALAKAVSMFKGVQICK